MSDVHKFFHNYFQKIYGFYCTVCMIWSNISQKMCTRHFLCVVLCVWCKSMVFDLLCIVDFWNSSSTMPHTLLARQHLINFLSWFSLHNTIRSVDLFVVYVTKKRPCKKAKTMPHLWPKCDRVAYITKYACSTSNSNMLLEESFHISLSSLYAQWAKTRKKSILAGLLLG